METAWDVYLRACPCREVLDLVANKWTALLKNKRAAGRPQDMADVEAIAPQRSMTSLERIPQLACRGWSGTRSRCEAPAEDWAV